MEFGCTSLSSTDRASRPELSKPEQRKAERALKKAAGFKKNNSTQRKTRAAQLALVKTRLADSEEARVKLAAEVASLKAHSAAAEGNIQIHSAPAFNLIPC